MKIKIKVPKSFIPEEKEFQIYCALKLYKGKYINKEGAMKMCGYISNKTGEEKFKLLYSLFEKGYKKLCGNGYADGGFKE